MSEESERVLRPRHVIAIVVLAVIVIFLLCVVFTNWLETFVVFETFNHVVENITHASSWPIYLVKSIVFLALIPFFLALKSIGKIPFLKGAMDFPRPVAWMVVAVYISAYFLAMYFASKAMLVGKWYFFFQQDIHVVDSRPPDGLDPATLRPLKKIDTQEIAEIINDYRRGLRPEPIPISKAATMQPFSPTTSEPLMFVAGEGPNLKIFSRRGFDPETARPMKPITNEVFVEVRRIGKAEASKEEAAKAARPAPQPVTTIIPDHIQAGLSTTSPKPGPLITGILKPSRTPVSQGEMRRLSVVFVMRTRTAYNVRLEFDGTKVLELRPAEVRQGRHLIKVPVGPRLFRVVAWESGREDASIHWEKSYDVKQDGDMLRVEVNDTVIAGILLPAHPKAREG